MTKEQIKKYLKNIGKGCFVQHYELFASTEKTEDEKIQILVDTHGYAEKSCAARIKKSQFIIKDGFGPTALKMIIKSDVAVEISKKATELLAKYPAK